MMENPIKMDELGGKPTIFGNTQLVLCWVILGHLKILAALSDHV